VSNIEQRQDRESRISYFFGGRAFGGRTDGRCEKVDCAEIQGQHENSSVDVQLVLARARVSRKFKNGNWRSGILSFLGILIDTPE
jgi:hypothetical protein